MRYIKTYKIFEKLDFDEFKGNITEILYPISDVGYNIRFFTPVLNDNHSITIRIVELGDNSLCVNDFIDEFDQLNDYIKSEGFDLVIRYAIGLIDKVSPLKRIDKYNDFRKFIDTKIVYAKSLILSINKK